MILALKLEHIECRLFQRICFCQDKSDGTWNQLSANKSYRNLTDFGVLDFQVEV